MTAFHLVRLECDRCGATVEHDEDKRTDAEGWVGLRVLHDRHVPKNDPPTEGYDLCPACLAGLRVWVDGGEEPA